MVRDIGGVETFWQTEKRPGVCKTAAITRAYQFLLSQLLASNGLKFDFDLFTITRESDVPTMLALLRDQMERLHWSVSPSLTEFGKDKVSLTAKCGRLQDDLLIGLQTLAYWGRLIIANRAQLEH